MIGRTELIETVAKTMDVPPAYVNLYVIDETLDAMLPLIKDLMASKIRGNDIKDAWPQSQDAYGHEEWFDVGTEHAARQIERFEL